jgi:hypothetical protein
MATTDTSKMLVNVHNEGIQTAYNGQNLWQQQTLVESTILQSMAFDYKGKETAPNIYVMQCKAGSTDGGKECGDLVLNKLNPDGSQATAGSTGTRLIHKHDGVGTFQIEDEWSYKYLTTYEKDGYGFGHGTQIGIEYAPDGIYLWFDHNSMVINRTLCDKSARWDVVGTQACRVKYSDSTTIKADSALVQPVTNTQLGIPDGGQYVGSAYHTISIDNVNKLFAVKYVDYTDNATMKVAVYKMDYTNYNGTAASINFIRR